MKKLVIAAISFVFLACNQGNKKENANYKDASKPVAERVELLLGQMTLEEKVAQLQCLWNEKKKLFNGNDFSEDSAKKYVINGLGQIGRPSENKTPEENAKLTNEIQKFFIEKTRLGIPVVFHEECLHGHAAPKKTSFSQPIGLACTFNKELIEQLYVMTAKEARAVGTHLALTPVVDVARDIRWGRVEETFGEDPYLVSQMGLSAVRGFQGRDSVVKGDHVMATLKHFAAHGQPESGMNISPVQVSERTLRETFLLPFKTCVEQGRVQNIMASYNEIDGVPSHVNSWLLEDVLRKEWNFQGCVVSDYYAIEELYTRHKIATDFDDAGIQSLNAGVDVELPEPKSFKNFVALVKAGKLDEKVIDKSVRRVLRQKFEMGLFDHPYVNVEEVAKKVDTEENHTLALQAAHETMVLLKNEGNTLPINSEKKLTIAVIGPNADRTLLGGYSGEPSYFVPVLEGIKAQFGDKHNIVYARGCNITKDSVFKDGKWIKTGWTVDPVELSDRNDNLKLIAQAKQVASGADIIILALGGNEQTSREGWGETHLGDRTTLDLVGEQNELVDAMYATGKPIVSLIFNGAPLAANNLYSKSKAVVECWYLGSSCGTAIADVLSGKVSPSGKLSISIPRSVGHIPAFYNHKPTARRGYLFDDVSPLFTFGYGLSYSTFEYSEPTLSKAKIKNGDSVQVSVKVKNTGSYDAKEAVQLYIRDEISSVTRPIKELKGFDKINLKLGEEKTVTFTLSTAELGFWNKEMKFVVEPGTFKIMTGSSSLDKDLKSVVLTVE